ncbi:hypothetical protein [Daejeonella lutea]|uniref:NVEALA protein n=1 Tax=Daejeonella lutea TaxID=572036 RepID=A0A1T5AZI5_9SPHI|nr:hypothetical protein [Daejeonella lutea]SKB40366.1 hypothetical protein SAMN05661099_1158 [Daejeonella lutea]
MKNFKINFGLIALILGSFVAFAFKAPEAKQNIGSSIQWFSYNPLAGDPDDPQAYSELPGEPECNGDADLCAIQAEEDGISGKPTQAGVDSPVAVREEL